MNQQNDSQLVERLIEFTNSSTQWCVDESASATDNVLHIIDNLMKDSQRIAHLSEDTLVAVKAFRQKLQLQFQEPKADFVKNDLSMTRTLIKELQYFVNEYEEIGTLVSPMIKSLQFQDRISQEIQHKVTMLNHWWKVRQSLEGEHLSEAQKTQFQESLRTMVTTDDEREILVKHGVRPFAKDEDSDDLDLF